MTHTTRSEWMVRGTSLIICFMLAGCMGSGSKTKTITEGPEVIVDEPDPEVPTVPDETPVEEEDIVDVVTDIVTDILTTSVSVTTITSTSGS